MKVNMFILLSSASMYICVLEQGSGAFERARWGGGKYFVMLSAYGLIKFRAAIRISITIRVKWRADLDCKSF